MQSMDLIYKKNIEYTTGMATVKILFFKQKSQIQHSKIMFRAWQFI